MRATEGREQQLFIVVLLSNLKRMGESALRWSFFTLNAFILTLYLCSTSTNMSGQQSQCPPGVQNCYGYDATANAAFYAGSANA
jgi:hypothetical protein